MYEYLKQGFSSWKTSSSEWKKKDWEHQCALISHNIFLKNNTLNFYIKKSLFWIKFGSRKLSFGLRSIILMILNSGKLVLIICAFCPITNQQMNEKHFSWMQQKNNKTICKAIFYCLQSCIFCIFKQTKTFFGKLFYYFFVTFICHNAFATIC